MYCVVKGLPAWFPGMGFKSDAAECRRLASEGMNAPYEWVRQRIVRSIGGDIRYVANAEFKEEGSAAPCMVADAISRYHLNDDSKNPELVDAVKHSAGTLYAGDHPF